MYSKKQLAEKFGVKPSTIAKYLSMGVLPPPSPRTGCTASYGPEHVAIMQEIWGWNGMKDTNMTLKDFAERRAIQQEAQA